MDYGTKVTTAQQPGEQLMAFELLPVVEQAAIESARLMGCGDRGTSEGDLPS